MSDSYQAVTDRIIYQLTQEHHLGYALGRGHVINALDHRVWAPLPWHQYPRWASYSTVENYLGTKVSDEIKKQNAEALAEVSTEVNSIYGRGCNSIDSSVVVARYGIHSSLDYLASGEKLDSTVLQLTTGDFNYVMKTACPSCAPWSTDQMNF